MNQKRLTVPALVVSFLTMAFVSNVALAGHPPLPKRDCRTTVNSTQTDNNSNSDIGPDEISDGAERTSTPGVDNAGDEFPSRHTDSNWDGGYDGPWSSDF